MKKGSLMKAVLCATGMLILILDGQTAVSGIRSGVEICLKTLIPSLFPFFIISGLIIGSLSGCSLPFLQWTCRLCRIPRGSESLLAIGFLSGYPVGAKNVYDVWSRQQIPDTDAQKLVLLCSNAGPAFIFGILGPIFSDLRWSWILFGLQIASALLTARLISGVEGDKLECLNSQAVHWPVIINQAIKSMSSVCAWVTIFRMVLEFLDRWFFWLMPDWARILAVGLLELSNGCIELANLQDTRICFILASLLLPFGGVCVLMQIQSVFPELNLKFYVKGKILQSILCLIMALIAVSPWDMQFISGMAIFFISIFFVYHFLRKRKKAVAIP